jgi:hypothetical protein
MFGNVRLNLVILTLKDLISTPLYSNLNVTIHHRGNNLFSMQTTLSNQTNDQIISSSNDFDFENEDHVICAPIDSMVTFQMFQKLKIMKMLYILLLQIKIFIL